MRPYDVVIVGGGGDELVAAHLLQRAGRRVVVLDPAAAPATGAQSGWVPPQVLRALDLDDGVRVEPTDPWLTLGLPDGGRLELWQDIPRTVEAIRHVSPRDAAAWPGFVRRMHRLITFLAALYARPAPDPTGRHWADLIAVAATGIRARRMGPAGMVDLLRVLPMSVATLLEEWFTHQALMGALAAGGLRHLMQGPYGGGTAFGLMQHAVGSPAGVFRLPCNTLAAVLAARGGVEHRNGAALTRVEVAAGTVTGVTLASGDTLPTRRVLSGAGPRRTLLDLVDADWLEPEFARAVANIRCRGTAARVTLPLEQPTEKRVLCHAPSLDYLERAYDDAKYGRISRNPWVEARCVHHRIEAHVQYAPYAPAEGGWTVARRGALGDSVVKHLAPCVPALEQKSAPPTVTVPDDIEAAETISQGHRYHGEHTLDQMLFMRPVAGWHRYRTPIDGLYLCGPGTHPGGTVTGASGWLAARTILRDDRS